MSTHPQRDERAGQLLAEVSRRRDVRQLVVILALALLGTGYTRWDLAKKDALLQAAALQCEMDMLPQGVESWPGLPY
jgi:hypothetical protein